MTPTIDIHAHCVVRDVEALVAEEPARRAGQEDQARRMGEESARHNRSLAATYAAPLTDLDERLRRMDAMGVDIQAVSISPTQYHYWAPPEVAAGLVEAANQGVARLCAARPDRLVGLGTVALQHPGLAPDQLAQAMALGLRGIMISTGATDPQLPASATMELSDPRFEPLWARAEELEALVFIHPFGCTLEGRLDRYYLLNVIGHPLETTIALSNLISSGTLDRHPRLRICAAHGGGYLPSYIGRSDHAYEVRPECRTTELPPSAYLRRIWFDSLVYRPDDLRHLIEVAGAFQVVLGTDYPFDMGVSDPLARLDALGGLSEQERDAIRGANAAQLLRLAPAP